jgi:hypothetical protein
MTLRYGITAQRMNTVADFHKRFFELTKLYQQGDNFLGCVKEGEDLVMPPYLRIRIYYILIGEWRP